MPGRTKSILENLSSYILWLVLAVLVTLTLFQVHATIIAVALEAVKNPATRPVGWSTDSVYGFDRLVWLVLGIFWLGWVMYSLEYLREGQKYHLLKGRIIRLLVIMGAIYLVCTILLFLLV